MSPDDECRNCGHTREQHGTDRAIYACPTAVRAALSPFRRVVCPCHGFEHGQALSVPLPPLLPPPDDEIPALLVETRPRGLLDRILSRPN